MFLAVASFLAIRFFVAKHSHKERKKTNIKRVVWWFVFLCYIFVVLGATMLSRGSHYEYDTLHPLFYSYKSAWISCSAMEWRNIILNILMIVPFGLLLPPGIKRLGKWYLTYAAGFLFSLFIELSQKVFKLGIFEWDDLFNNTLGAIIGFGLYVIVIKIFDKDRKSVRKTAIIASNIPLVATVVFFATIRVIYSTMELGINNNRYIEVYDTDLLNIHGAEFTDDTISSLPVYRNSFLSQKETQRRAEELFERIDGSYDIYFEDYYDDEAWFRSRIDKTDSQVVVKYKGGTVEYTNMDLFSAKAVSFSETEVRALLAQYGYEIDGDTAFIQNDDSRLTFKIEKAATDSGIKDGKVTVELTADMKIKRLYDSVHTYEYYEDFEAISQEEAYNRLKTGRFKRYGNDNLDIEVLKCEISYSMDSKGFYQPDYCFYVRINGKDAEIMIPALDSK